VRSDAATARSNRDEFPARSLSAVRLVPGKRYDRETARRPPVQGQDDRRRARVPSRAVEVLRAHPKISVRLKALYDGGSRHTSAGQPATTLYGPSPLRGEAKLVKAGEERASVVDGGDDLTLDGADPTGLHFRHQAAARGAAEARG